MLRGTAKITQIETFLNQVINEKSMLQHDNTYADKSEELNGLVKLKRHLMKKLFNTKNKQTLQKNKLTKGKLVSSSLEKFVNTDYTISETDLNEMVEEKHKLMKKLFNAKEKNYYQNTHFTKEKISSAHIRNTLEVNVNSNTNSTQEKIDAIKNDLMSQNKLFQIKENEYRKKKYYIFIWKHITSFSILSLLTLLFMKTGHVSVKNTYSLITIYFIVLLMLLTINHLYFNRRNNIYFHKYNWANKKQAEELPNCVA